MIQEVLLQLYKLIPDQLVFDYVSFTGCITFVQHVAVNNL